jgi:protein-S-isoprenylcysteine O-methyltransferase Ste14
VKCCSRISARSERGGQCGPGGLGGPGGLRESRSRAWRLSPGPCFAGVHCRPLSFAVVRCPQSPLLDLKPLEFQDSLTFSLFVPRRLPLVPPPLVVLILLLISAGLMAVFPVNSMTLPASTVIGIIFLIIGLAFGFSGVSMFRKAGTSLRPGDEPTQFVTQGPFRITRNPMYLGFELFLIAFLFFTKSAFFLIPPVVFFFLMNFVQIPFEEKLMTEHYGQIYTAYCQRVRRWL